MKQDSYDKAFSLARSSADAVVVLGAVALACAWFFQLVIGIKPCTLCLEQRYAYYLSTPLAMVLVLASGRKAPWPLLAAGFAIIIAASVGNAALGVYHSGVEWKLWLGPNDCSGPLLKFGNAADLLDRLDTVNVVRCDEVQWRFLGLSLAGYSVLVSILMALFASRGLICIIKK